MLDTTILLGVLMFTVMVLALVGMILFARSQLVSSGNVTIFINDDPSKSVEVPAGGKLLSTLADKGIFLASACGGGGTCAQCRCRVTEGGGSILATEEGHFNRGEISDDWRLSCQVAVKQDLKIEVPDDALGVQRWECEVTSNPNVASMIKELDLKLPEGADVAFSCMQAQMDDNKTRFCQAKLRNTTVVMLAGAVDAWILPDFSALASVLDAGYLCGLIAAVFYFKWSLRVTEESVDRDRMTITDYAVQVSGFPPSTQKADIVKFFSEKFDPNLPGRI